MPCIKCLTAENARLRDDLCMAKDRMALAETGKRVLEANVVALHDTVAELRAENARLRSDYNLLLGETQTLRELARKFEADIVDAGALHLADEQSVRNMERRMTEWQRAAQSQERLAASLTADLARVTAERDDSLFERHLAVAECGRLRTEVEIAYKSRNEAVERANLLEWHTVPDLAADLERARANALLHASRNVELDADLARVTAERDAQTDHALELIDQLHEFKDQRDALLAAARDMLASAGSSLSASEIRKQEQREEARNGLISAVAACERAAIAACAPPASGEVKP